MSSYDQSGGINAVVTRTYAATYRSKVYLAGMAVIAETGPAAAAIISAPALVDGTLHCVAVGLLAGDIITSISIYVNSLGVTLTLSKVGIYNASSVLVASSAELGTAWESTGIKTNALSAPYVVPATGLYYSAVICKGATRPSVSRTTGSALMGPTGIGTGAAAYCGQTGQTDLPSTATLTATTMVAPWMALT